MRKRDALKGRPEKLATEQVPTPEWADVGIADMTIREMTSLELDRWQMDCHEKKRKKLGGKLAFRASAIVRCALDDDGSKMFQESDASWLALKGASVISRIFAAIRRLNNLDDDDSEDGTPEKNPSASDTSGASATG